MALYYPFVSTNILAIVWNFGEINFSLEHFMLALLSSYFTLKSQHSTTLFLCPQLIGQNASSVDIFIIGCLYIFNRNSLSFVNLAL